MKLSLRSDLSAIIPRSLLHSENCIIQLNFDQITVISFKISPVRQSFLSTSFPLLKLDFDNSKR